MSTNDRFWNSQLQPIFVGGVANQLDLTTATLVPDLIRFSTPDLNAENSCVLPELLSAGRRQPK
jgi:hypothetical protein